MSDVILKQVNAFAVSGNGSKDRNYIKGYFLDKDIASTQTKWKGWDNGDATVIPVVVYQDMSGKIYDLELLSSNGFIDGSVEERSKLIESIKSKLTPEERRLLGLN